MAAPTALDSRVSSFLRGAAKRLLIGGEWVEAVSGKTFSTTNPATGEELAQVAAGDAEDINRAVAAARTAFTGPWSTISPADRAKIIWRIADLIEEHAEEFAQLEK